MSELSVVAQDQAQIEMAGTELTITIPQQPGARNVGDIVIRIVGAGSGNRLDNEADIELQVIAAGGGNRPDGSTVVPLRANFISTTADSA